MRTMISAPSSTVCLFQSRPGVQRYAVSYRVQAVRSEQCNSSSRLSRRAVNGRRAR
jgi:hypothetical protein